MSTEQFTPQEAFDQSPRQTETILNDGDNLGFDIGDIARREKIVRALADVNAAIPPAQPTQPNVAIAQERAPDAFEHRSAQIKAVGQAAYMVVYGLRKPKSEHSIDLFSTIDTEPTAPYLQSQSSIEDASKEASWKGFHEQSF